MEMYMHLRRSNTMMNKYKNDILSFSNKKSKTRRAMPSLDELRMLFVHKSCGDMSFGIIRDITCI